MPQIITQTRINDILNKAKTRFSLLQTQADDAEVLGRFDVAKKLNSKSFSILAKIRSLELAYTLTDTEKEDLVQALIAEGDLLTLTKEYDYSNCSDISSGSATTLPIDHLKASDIINTGVYNHFQIDNHINSTNNPHQTKISNLTDVQLTSITTGQGLKWDGSRFVNGTVGRTIKNNGVALADVPNLDFGSFITAVNNGQDTDVNVNVIDDDSMATASATTLATSESIKAYVDSLQEVFGNGLTEIANNVTLGGSLTQATQLSTQLNRFTIDKDTGFGFYRTKIQLDGNTNTIQLSSTDGTNIAGIFATDNTFELRSSANTGVYNYNLIMSPTTAIFRDYRGTTIGLQYHADYSADFTDRTLIDKAYADGLSKSAGNGITDLSGVLDLGGTLTKDANIQVNGSNEFIISTSDDSYTSVFGTGSNGILFQAQTDLNNISQIILSESTNSLIISHTSTGESTSFEFINNSLTFNDNRTTKLGIEYGGDYSNTFGANSLISKKYTDDHIASQSVDALVSSPTASEDGYVISWNDTNSEYELVAQSGGSGLWTAGTGDDIYYNTGTPQVGIGNASPSYSLDVTGTIRATVDVIHSSDKRLKDNIKQISLNAIETLSKLNPVSYNRKSNPYDNEFGLIAQEVDQIEELKDIVKIDDKGFYSLSYNQIIPLLVKAIQELKEKVDGLTK